MAPNWSPMPAEAARPRDLPGLYAGVGRSLEEPECGSCAKVRKIVPDLARGLQSLYGQLRSLLPRGRSSGAEVRDWSVSII